MSSKIEVLMDAMDEQEQKVTTMEMSSWTFSSTVNSMGGPVSLSRVASGVVPHPGWICGAAVSTDNDIPDDLVHLMADGELVDIVQLDKEDL